MEWFIDFLLILRDLFVYGLCGLAGAYYYYSRLNRDLLGGFWGATLIGTIGAVLIHVIANIQNWFPVVVNFLMLPKWENTPLARVNIIAALIGSFLFVYVLNRINHDKERRR